MAKRKTTAGSANAELRLRSSEAAELLGVSRQTILAYEARGLIKAERLPSGHRRYLRSDVEKLRSAA